MFRGFERGMQSKITVAARFGFFVRKSCEANGKWEMNFIVRITADTILDLTPDFGKMSTLEEISDGRVIFYLYDFFDTGLRLGLFSYQVRVYRFHRRARGLWNPLERKKGGLYTVDVLPRIYFFLLDNFNNLDMVIENKKGGGESVRKRLCREI